MPCLVPAPGEPLFVSFCISVPAIGLKSHVFHIENIISSKRVSEKTNAETCSYITLHLYGDRKRQFLSCKIYVLAVFQLLQCCSRVK